MGPGLGNVSVCIVIPSLDDGGIERAALNLADGFLGHGLSVDLVVCQALSGPLVSELPELIEVLELGRRSAYGSVMDLGMYFRSRRPRLTIAYQTPANVAASLGRVLSRRDMSLAVNVQVTVARIRDESPTRVFLRGALYRALGLLGARIVTPSEGVRDDLVSLGVSAGQVSVIPNAVVTPRVMSLAAEPIDDSWIQGPWPIVMAAGRLCVQKDYPTLLHAFRLVCLRSQARLAIFGEGPLRGELEGLVSRMGLSGRVRFYGFTNNVYQYMRAADVFVLSSAWEGFANVVPEALAVGTNVVATDCPWGPAEILERGKWGRLVPVGDVEEMAVAIWAAISQPRARPDQVERGMTYSSDRVASAYLREFGVVA